MAMSVMHNSGAALALGELNKNVNKVGKLLGKVSSGMKINSAQDDSASFAISEKMREQIRSLLQDNQNVQNGSSLLRTAEGGIDEIVDELRRLKELALNSANDHNSEVDRKIIQKEFKQRMANINDIATETNYNGKPLLDGTYRNIEKTKDGPESIHSDYVINFGEDGTYTLAPDFNGTITINAQNVKIKSANPSVPVTATIIGPSGGNANIWIEDVNIRGGIKFQGSNNTLTVKGKNTVTATGREAAINVGNGLSIIGNFDNSELTATGSTGAGVGTAAGERKPNAYINIGGGFTLNASAMCGASIGSGDNSTIGDITIGNNAKVVINGREWGAGIGSGEENSYAGNITICDNAEVSGTVLYGAGIGRGAYGGTRNDIGDISISTSARVNITSRTGDDIGNGYLTYGDFNLSYTGGLTSDVKEQFEPGKATIKDGYDWKPLVIQEGTQANQNVNFFINNMHTKFLKGQIPNETDMERLNNLSGNKYKEYHDLVTKAGKMTLDDVSLLTQKNAQIATRVIEGAIDYALDESTRMGSYIQRLEYTDSNITTMGENVQASESTIRDADMAKEMTEYTKYNILTQSSQAMLAQANQNSSQVLSLLQ